jgi:hypothetical protein
MHAYFAAQATDLYRAEAERTAREARLAREARRHSRSRKGGRGQRSGSVRRALRTALGKADRSWAPPPRGPPKHPPQ